MKKRLSWEQYALTLAYAASTRSEDPYIQVGAAALRHDNSTAGTGYNGAPPGIELDWTDRDKRREYVIHAERNLCNYIKPGECKLIATTLLPCSDCLKEIAIKGVKKVVFSEVYTTDPNVAKKSYETAQKYKIELIHMPAQDQEKNFPKFPLPHFSFLSWCAKLMTRMKGIFKL